MKLKSFFLYLILCISMPLLMVACQNYDESLAPEASQQGLFSVEYPKTYSISLTRGANDMKKWTKKTRDMEIGITESEWNADSIVSTRSRSVVTNDANWDDIPNIALYIGDSQNFGSCSFTDIPLNPINHFVFEKYYNPNDVTESITNKEGNAITGSSFFWNDWKNHSMPTSANFYAYYPRPCDLVNSGNFGVKYTPISILDRSEARSGRTDIRYTFMSNQSDENISYHDIMCSISEDEKNNEHYGNINKTANNNIQLRFKHMFCLLEFEVNKGSYQGSCQVTELKLSGKQIYTSGTLDIINCQTIPTNGNSEINRSFDAHNIEENAPFKTTMIVQPTTDNASLDNADNERLVVSCTINGAKYSCPLPKATFEAGKKYKICLTLKPSEILNMQIWDGVSVMVGDKTYTKGAVTLTPKNITEFKVTPNDEHTGIKVLRNGENIAQTSNEGNSYTYTLDMDAGKKTTYNIVAYPINDTSVKWYVMDGMRVHFDAKWNDKYDKDKQHKSITYWNDLSGHDNDGLLKSFDSNETSGWNTTDGLVFDGIDDIVTFFGDIGTNEYTLEFFININSSKEQTTGNDKFHFKRLIGEPDSRYDSFPAIYMTSNDYIGFMGQGVDTSFGNILHVFSQKVQYDFVYQNKKITVYINGDAKGTIILTSDASKKQTASLGNRTMDNSRAIKATYHSFIMYDKALTKEKIKQNYEANQDRFK